jgi:hypothetical protein
MQQDRQQAIVEGFFAANRATCSQAGQAEGEALDRTGPLAENALVSADRGRHPPIGCASSRMVRVRTGVPSDCGPTGEGPPADPLGGFSNGRHPFNPRLTTNRSGDPIIEKQAVAKGPKRGKRGYVDDQGRIWIKDRGHAGLPDHWDVQTGGWGLLATGSAGRWDVSVDESREDGSWSLEIDGPRVYLALQLLDLEVVRRAFAFLRSPPSAGWRAEEATLVLGRFGTASVALIWDNESPPKCFIVIGLEARSTLRITLETEDVGMMVEALRQAIEDLPPTSEAQRETYTGTSHVTPLPHPTPRESTP